MRILRETLVALLSLEEDIEVVAQVADGPAILPAAIGHRPDVALLDIGLPGGTACPPRLSWRGYCRDPRSSC